MDGQPQGGQGQQQRGNNNAPVMPAVVAVQKNTSTDTAKATVDATGVWNYTMESQMGATTGKITIKKEGDVYSGNIFSSRNNKEVPFTSVIVAGNELTASYTANFGGNEVQITISGPINGDVLDGTMNFGGMRSMPFKAERAK
jgi:hypothetical protein